MSIIVDAHAALLLFQPWADVGIVVGRGNVWCGCSCNEDKNLTTREGA
jgi:hypothetical protein